MIGKTTVQYATEANLRARIETHRRYSVGSPLETLVDDVLRLTGAESLLDIGTGPGDFPGRLRAAGHTGRLVGLDASAGMVARANEKHFGVEYVLGDAMSLPFSDASFDVVTAHHMLYHVPNVETALLEAKRVLKLGGRFLALTNADGYMREFWAAVEDALQTDPAFTGLLYEHSQPKYFHGGLERQVRAAFNRVKLTVVDQWLEFPELTPVLAYWDSIRAGEGLTDDDWARGREKFISVLETRFRGGAWRVWKGIAFLEAQS